uniref:Uncharacterized protein n=1 Tax=Anguilla anguilla TaxID=7936 RepID=A0A0E9QLJ5_ANGAN
MFTCQWIIRIVGTLINKGKLMDMLRPMISLKVIFVLVILVSTVFSKEVA